MSVPRFRRKESGLEFVDNAYNIQVEVMTLCSKLSNRWVRIYQQPIDRLCTIQADLVNMVSNMKPVRYEDYIVRRTLLRLSNACLCALEKRIMDMIRILYTNPSKCFNRKNGKNYTRKEATIMLDNKLENLGVMYQRQYDLLKGVMEADRKKFAKLSCDDISDKEIIDMVVSKLIGMSFL